MPGSMESRAMALADMTESPIAVTSRPGTGRVGDGLAAGSEPGAFARVAAPTRSPVMICFSIPDDAEGAWKTPHPAVTAPSPAVPATAKTAAAAAAARLLANSLVFLPLTAIFFAARRQAQTRSCRIGGEGAVRHSYPIGPGPAVSPSAFSANLTRVIL